MAKRWGIDVYELRQAVSRIMGRGVSAERSASAAVATRTPTSRAQIDEFAETRLFDPSSADGVGSHVPGSRSSALERIFAQVEDPSIKPRSNGR